MKSMLPMFGNNKTLVSPKNAWPCKYVETDFILDSHSNFVAFFRQSRPNGAGPGGLDFFVTFSSKPAPQFLRGEK